MSVLGSALLKLSQPVEDDLDLRSGCFDPALSQMADESFAVRCDATERHQQFLRLDSA